MNELSITLPDGASIRRTEDGRVSVYDALKSVGAKNARDAWKRLSEAYPEVVGFCDNLKFAGSGQRETPVTDARGWRRIVKLLPNTLGKQFRAAESELIDRALAGDARLAVAIGERNSSPAQIMWAGARLLAKSTVLSMNGAMKAAGCTGDAYPFAHDTNNLHITGMRARELKQARGVKHTRDGYSTAELGLLIAAQATQTKGIQQEGARGDGEVLSIVADVATQVGVMRKALIGPVKYPAGGLLTVDV